MNANDQQLQDPAELPTPRRLTDDTPDPTEYEVTCLVAAFPLFAAVYFAGQDSQRLTNEQAADLAARKFAAASHIDDEIHKQVKADIGWYDVAHARAEQRARAEGRAAA